MTDYAAVAAQIEAALDAGRDWPGGPLCRVELSNTERIYAYRYARDFFPRTAPDDPTCGALVFHRDDPAGSKYMGVVVWWAAFRDMGHAMLRFVHEDAREGMDRLGDTPPWQKEQWQA